MKKRMIWMIIALIIIFGGIFGWDMMRSIMMKRYFAHYQPPPKTISSATATLTTWNQEVPAVGSIVSYQDVNITPQQSGQIDQILFKSGDVVKKGQPLLHQDTSLDIQQLKQNEAKLNLAKVSLDRQFKLYKKGFVSAETIDQLKAQLEEASANVSYTQTIIDQKTIKAPFDGKIGIRMVNLGQYVSNSTELTSLQSMDPLRVLFYVPEQYYAELSVGDSVKITTNVFPKDVFTGKVTAINSEINQGTRNLQIEANLPNPDLKLYPGMFANVQVELPKAQKMIIIPQTAVNYNMYGDSVFVLTADKTTSKKDSQQKIYTAHLRYVTLGDSRGNEVAVLKGLKAGEQVVSSGQLKIQDGNSVIINNSANINEMPSSIDQHS